VFSDLGTYGAFFGLNRAITGGEHKCDSRLDHIAGMIQSHPAQPIPSHATHVIGAGRLTAKSISGMSARSLRQDCSNGWIGPKLFYSLEGNDRETSEENKRRETQDIENALINEVILDAGNLSVKGVLPTSLNFYNRPPGADNWELASVNSSLSGNPTLLKGLSSRAVCVIPSSSWRRYLLASR
jgi:hypothetical protein